MSTPNQPPAAGEPVTPPPEWAVKAAERIHDQMTLSEIAAVIAQHAFPPAPSCPTEQGELVEGEYDENWPVLQRLQWRARWTSNPKIAKDCRDAIAALSRQPAPVKPECMTQSEFDEAVGSARHSQRPAPPADELAYLKSYVIPEKDKHGKYWHDLAQERVARIASLESEVARLKELKNIACLAATAARAETDRIRAAPSAVAKDRAELARVVVERLTAIREERRIAGDAGQWIALGDAISLLSQPAVAQTEAGNDMTTADPKDSARLDWLLRLGVSVRWSYQNSTGGGAMDQRYDTREAIDAAIAATKAKEGTK